MGMHGLLFSLRRLRRTGDDISQKHSELLSVLDSVSFTQDQPSKFYAEISVFEEMAVLINDLQDKDALMTEQIRLLYDDFLGVEKLLTKAKNLRTQLNYMKERLQRDEKFILSTIHRVGGVLEHFRSRCKSEFTEFLKSLDYDLRKILKPLVPSAVIEENVQFPGITKSDSLESSMKSEEMEEEVDADETEKLNNHINMLVGTLEGVAKELIQILGEANRKYFEFVGDFGSQPPTPLAAPLPEYFTFEQEEESQDFWRCSEDNIQKLKEKVKILADEGDLTQVQAKDLKKRLESISVGSKLNFQKLFDDGNVPEVKREDIVYKLITSGAIEINDDNKDFELIRDFKQGNEHKKDTKKSLEKDTKQKKESISKVDLGDKKYSLDKLDRKESFENKELLDKIDRKINNKESIDKKDYRELIDKIINKESVEAKDRRDEEAFKQPNDLKFKDVKERKEMKHVRSNKKQEFREGKKSSEIISDPKKEVFNTYELKNKEQKSKHSLDLKTESPINNSEPTLQASKERKEPYDSREKYSFVKKYNLQLEKSKLPAYHKQKAGKEKKKQETPPQNRKELRIRSITPVSTDSRGNLRSAKTPIPKRFRHLIK